MLCAAYFSGDKAFSEREDMRLEMANDGKWVKIRLLLFLLSQIDVIHDEIRLDRLD